MKGMHLTTWASTAFAALITMSFITGTASAQKKTKAATPANAGTAALTPAPANWPEHWFEHKENLQLKFQDTSVAVYFDSGMPAVTWPFSYMAQVWNYTKSTYGAFGEDPRLFCVFHATTYSGGHPATYFDRSHDHHNTIDVGSTTPNSWVTGANNDLDMCTHEVGHIVEGAAHGVKRSPAFGIWGDSKWMEIYIYDVYKGLGRDADATRWYNMMMRGTDNSPHEGVHWFKDWFFPIYDQYGGTKVLQQFFILQSTYFPQKGEGLKREYSRDMNWGEFIHFWSGAAGHNLKPLATKAFGWSQEWETQFVAAQKEFAGIKYAE